MKSRLVYPLLLVAAVLAIYFPSLRNGFVWDDTALVLADPLIRSWRLIAEGFRHYLFIDATPSDFYRPLQRLTYTWDYAWFGFQPWAYHLTNLLIHAGAAVALFLFMERFLTLLAERSPETSTAPAPATRLAPATWAAIVAGLWAIHPLHSSAVCYIAGRADLLAGFCGFLALWLSLREGSGARISAALLFLGALLSKESGIIFLPLCLVILLFLGRPVRLWLGLGTAVFCCYGLLRWTAEYHAPPPGPEMVWQTRPIVFLRALAEYAGLLLAPFHLHMERDVLPFNRGDFTSTLLLARDREFQTLLGALLLAALLGWLRWAARRERPVLALLACFLIAYAPVCGLFTLNASVAEHWLYVASAFLLPAALLSLARLRIPLSRPACAAVLGAWAILLGGRTFLRNADWHDQRTFLERTIADGGGSARMYINLGTLESSQGRQPQAIADYQRALALKPEQPFALIGLGIAYLKAGRFPEAHAPLKQAMQIPLVAPEALDAFAVLEYQENRKDDVDTLRQAAAMDPANWQIQKRYILHLAELARMMEAIAALRNVVAGQPWRGESWRILGDFWTHVHRYDSAERAYAEAAALDVHDEISVQRGQAVHELAVQQNGGQE